MDEEKKKTDDRKECDHAPLQFINELCRRCDVCVKGARYGGGALSCPTVDPLEWVDAPGDSDCKKWGKAKRCGTCKWFTKDGSYMCYVNATISDPAMEPRGFFDLCDQYHPDGDGKLMVCSVCKKETAMAIDDVPAEHAPTFKCSHCQEKEDSYKVGIEKLFDGPTKAWFNCPDDGPFEAMAEDEDMTAVCMATCEGESPCGTTSPRFTCGVCASRSEITGTCFNPDKCNKPLEDSDPVFGNGAPVVPGKLAVLKVSKGCRHFEIRPTKAQADKWHPDNLGPVDDDPEVPDVNKCVICHTRKGEHMATGVGRDHDLVCGKCFMEETMAGLVGTFIHLDDAINGVKSVNDAGVDKDDTNIQRLAVITLAGLYRAKASMIDLSDSLVRNGGESHD